MMWFANSAVLFMFWDGFTAGGVAVSTPAGRLEYTVPASRLEYTVPASRLEFTVTQ